MKYTAIFLYLAFLSFAQISFSQYYDTGQDPSSLKWMQIKTGRFTVIYPRSFGAGGISFAKSLDEAYSNLVSLYPETKFKIPVVIHNLTIQSNGYVAWAPRRMEIYPTPEQNTIPLDHERQLAIHELTHVIQMESLNNGFTKGMNLLLGEQFTGFVSSFLPLWLLEGDAVFAETALTESGRGRVPSFQKQLKAISVEKGNMYKYDKITNGSYRDYIPNHYQSGYQMVTWAIAKHDPQIWNKVINYTGKEPFSLTPVNISLSINAGLTKKKLFKEAFDSLNALWIKDVSVDNPASYENMNPEKKGEYVNYYSPVIAGSDSIIAIKTSLTSPPSFVLINPSGKTEKIIHIPGQMYPWYISYADGKVVWVENQPDPRWENREYSVIKLYDLKKNRTTRLSSRSRYLAASVSPDGKKIAAIENTVSDINKIVFINAENGAILESFNTPGNIHLQRPQWSADGEKISVISLTEAGEGIMSFALSGKSWKTLLESGRNDLQSSFLRNDSLFFISSLSGTENIYLMRPDKTVTGLTRSKYGANDLFLDKGSIIFCDYTSQGNNICSARISESLPMPYTEFRPSSFLINSFDFQNNRSGKISLKSYTPEPYRKWKHLLKFHSWMPFYADVEEIKADPASIRPGFSIMSQNNLSTVMSSIGYEYSPEKNHVFHSRISLKAWYPVIESQLDYGNVPLVSKVGESVGDPDEIKAGMRFSNTIYLPLRFSSGKFFEYLRGSVTSEYFNNYIYIKEEGTYDYGQTILSGRFYFSNYHRSAFRDILPRWAQVLDLNYSFAPFDKVVYGTASTIKTAFYFPGIFPNNGIKIRIEREIQHPSKFMYGNRVPFPRGYKNIRSNEINLFSVDYVLPLAYPDFNISSLLFLKRLRTSLFYDYANATGNYYHRYPVNGVPSDFYHDYTETFRTYGFELMADFHVLRIPFMISGGIQTAWKNLTEPPVFELLFNIDLFGMSIGQRQI